MPFVLLSQPAAAYDDDNGSVAKAAEIAQVRLANIMRDVESLVTDHSKLPSQSFLGYHLFVQRKTPGWCQDIEVEASGALDWQVLHRITTRKCLLLSGQSEENECTAICGPVIQRR